jgi:putative transposase
VSKETVSKITDQVLEEMAGWLARPLDEVYPVIFIDAIVVKVRDGQVRNKPIDVVIARRRRGCVGRSGGGLERQRRAHCWRRGHRRD